MKKKVLVTGSSGFIAPHVINKFLENNWEVLAVDIADCAIKNEQAIYIKKDLRELSPNDLKDIDCVVHLAFVTNIPYSVQNPIATTYDTITTCI